ncbi:BamA/TamA family outer membrane protein, partial [Calditrichota bacterium]
EPITLTGLQRGISNLYATGLFRIVTAIFERNVDGSWRINMHVTENPSALIRLGLSYFGEHADTQGERLTRGFAEVLYPSPFNYAARMVIFGSFGSYDKIFRTSFLADKIFGLPLNYDLTFFSQDIKRDTYSTSHQELGNYQEDRWGGQFKFGGTARAWGMLEFSTRLEHHRTEYPTHKKNYNLGAVGARLALDTEDRSPFPGNGVKMITQAESATEVLGSVEKFSKLSGEFEAYITPINRTTLGMRFSGATADRLTPRDEQFKMGGMYSFPGLHLDQLIGTLQLLGGAEVRYDLVSRVFADSYLGVRYDLGSSWDDPEPQLTREDWMQSISTYIAFDTLLGPIMLQWSVLFDGGRLTKQDILYIQLGNKF